MIVRELELDLDAFEGPFDLLLTLILKEELDLADVDVAGIVVRFVERLAEREELDLDACGEFLVLVAALLELKARGLFEDEAAELSELEPEEAAEELARRLAEYRRMKEAAGWLSERLAERARPLLPARAGAAGAAARAEARAAGAGVARRGDPAAGEGAAGRVAESHGASLSAGGAVPRALPRAAARAGRGSTSTPSSAGCRAPSRRLRSWRCSSSAAPTRSPSARPRRSPRSVSVGLGRRAPPQTKGPSRGTSAPPSHRQSARPARAHARGAARRRERAAAGGGARRGARTTTASGSRRRWGS